MKPPINTDKHGFNGGAGSVSIRVYPWLTIFFALSLYAFGGSYGSQVGGPKIGDATTLPPGFVPRDAEGVRVDEHLGLLVDLSFTFTNEDGAQVPLGSFFHKGRPVILDLVYYQCPMLC